MNIITDTRVLSSNLEVFSKYGDVYFPLKANSSEEIVKLIDTYGCKGFLINSKEQIDKILKYKISANKVTQISTLMSEADLKYIHSKGVRSFVFDTMEQLVRFIDSVEDVNDIEISIKCSIGYVGIPVNTGASIETVIKMAEYLKSIHCKYGVSCYMNKAARKVAEPFDMMCRIVEIAQHTQSRFISLGGISNTGVDNISIAKISRISKESGLELRLEPGQSVMQNVQKVESTILDVNRTGSNVAITIEGSVYNQLFDLVGLGREFRVEAICGKKVSIVQSNKNKCAVSIFGASGDSNDTLGTIFLGDTLDINTGGTVTIKDTGYYFGRQ